MNGETKEFGNNHVVLSGKIVEDFKFSHESHGENFYQAMLSSERLSGKCDVLPIVVSDRLFDIDNFDDATGRFLRVEGQYRSFNRLDENGRAHLKLFVFVTDISDGTLKDGDGETICWCDNEISINGYICKPAHYRETPLGRKIADVMIAVNRNYNKSDYIPCIFWGRSARFVSNLEVGTGLRIAGRIQSREYIKRISDDEQEARIAYEVSVQSVEVLEEVEGE